MTDKLRKAALEALKELQQLRPQNQSPFWFRITEDLRAALAQPAASGEPAEWQGRVGNRGRWRRIDPPPGETMEQRVAYLRSMPAYEIRALYTTAQPAPARVPLSQDAILDMAEGCTLQFHDLLEFARKVERAHGIAAPALVPLTDEQALEIAVTATPPGSVASRHQIVKAIRLAERHHGIFPSKENPL